MIKRLPAWFKQELPDDKALKVSNMLSEFCVDTVCQQAKCPNITHCFKNKKVTFMILGNRCTRNCGFCNVNKAQNSNLSLDSDEPKRISEAVKILGLEYVVITSVTRDDLKDGGSSVFAETIKLIRSVNRQTKIEVLIPDFEGKASSLKNILDAKPDVVAHNIETVKRLSRVVRPSSDYQLSLDVLSKIKELEPSMFTKSSILLGLGEREEEVIEAMHDLRESFCDCLTLGQYLAPSAGHYPVKEFVNIDQFQKYSTIGLGLGFKSVLSGPLVRSSYRAEETYLSLTRIRQQTKLNLTCQGLIRADNLLSAYGGS